MSVYKFCFLLLCPWFCFAQAFFVDKNCDRPDLQNGRIFSGENFPARKNADLWYNCNGDFDPVYKEVYSWYGSNMYGKSTCTANGWQPMPKCVALCWGSAAQVSNAAVSKYNSERYKEGEKVRFECYGDLKTEDGSKYGEIECLPNHKFSEARCLTTSCESAPEITNAVLLTKKTNFNSGDKAYYRCNSGYVFNKDQTSAICKNSHWEELPECRKQGQSCGSPPVVQFGDTLENIQPTNKHGTVMNYKCPEYYILEGSKAVMCRNGKWDDPPICIEPCTVSERDLTSNNIRLKWKTYKKLYSRHNEWVGFLCSNGYEISDEKLLRIQCNRGNLLYPKCTKIEEWLG